MMHAIFHPNTTLDECFENGVASFGFNHGGNSIVKRAQAVVALGWVTYWGVLVLHPCEHHLDPMSAKCSVYSHDLSVPFILMRDGFMLNHYS